MNKFYENLLRVLLPYKAWLRLRDKSKDEFGEKLCYCGHTHKCTCADPDCALFRESVQRGSIILWDEENGWRSADTERLTIILTQVADLKMDVETAVREISKYMDEYKRK